jgi:hypothetical protein
VRLSSLWQLGPMKIGPNLFSRSCHSSVHIVFPFSPHRTVSTIQWLSYSSICDFHGFLSGLSNFHTDCSKIFLFPMWNIRMVPYQLPFLWVSSFSVFVLSCIALGCSASLTSCHFSSNASFLNCFRVFFFSPWEHFSDSSLFLGKLPILYHM